MEVLLATLREPWYNEAENGCDVEKLVDDNGLLTFVADMSFPNNQHYEEVYDDGEKALDWIYHAQERAAETFSATFTATEALFGRFPQLIDSLGADLANLTYKANDADIVETLSRKDEQLRITIYTLGDNVPIDKAKSTRIVSEQDAANWLSDAKVIENAKLRLTEAGAIVYPDLAKELDAKEQTVNKKNNVKLER